MTAGPHAAYYYDIVLYETVTHARSDAATVPLDFLSPIHKASRQIGLYLDAPCGQAGLTPGEAHLLSYLGSYGPCPISELHRVFGTKRSTLTSMLDRLSARGLVTREVDPEDRRSFLVGLTREGKVLARWIRSMVEDLEARIRARVSREEMKSFRSVMAAIAEVTRVEVRTTEKRP